MEGILLKTFVGKGFESSKNDKIRAKNKRKGCMIFNFLHTFTNQKKRISHTCVVITELSGYHLILAVLQCFHARTFFSLYLLSQFDPLVPL